MGTKRSEVGVAVRTWRGLLVLLLCASCGPCSAEHAACIDDSSRVLICMPSGGKATTTSIVKKQRAEHPTATDGICEGETGARAFEVAHDAVMLTVGDAFVWTLCALGTEAEPKSAAP